MVKTCDGAYISIEERVACIGVKYALNLSLRSFFIVDDADTLWQQDVQHFDGIHKPQHSMGDGDINQVRSV